MTRTLSIVAALIVALAVGTLGLGRASASPDERLAMAAVDTWLSAAAQRDVSGMCAVEAVPQPAANRIAMRADAWAAACPKTYDPARVSNDAAGYQQARAAGPTSTVTWAGSEIRVSYDDQNLAFYAVEEDGAWRVRGAGTR